MCGVARTAGRAGGTKSKWPGYMDTKRSGWGWSGRPILTWLSCGRLEGLERADGLGWPTHGTQVGGWARVKKHWALIVEGRMGMGGTQHAGVIAHVGYQRFH